MNTAHWHLALNHFPVLGTLFGSVLFLLGNARRSGELKRTSYGVFVAAALLSVPAYFTGKPAEDWVKPLPGISQPVLEEHEEAAQVALAASQGLGLVSLAALWWFRGDKCVPLWLTGLILLLALLATSLLLWTANLGGQVRHTEIRPMAWRGSGSHGTRSTLAIPVWTAPAS